jgi:hypothetical protein
MKFLEIIISVCTAGCVLGLDVYQDDIRLLKEELESLKSETSKFLIFKSFFFTSNYLHKNDSYLPSRRTVFCVMFCRSLFDLLSFFSWPLFCLTFVRFMASDYLFKYKLPFVAFYNGQHCYLKSSCVLILSATCFDVYNYMLSYPLRFTPKSVVQFVIAVIWFVVRLILVYFIYVFCTYFRILMCHFTEFDES